MIVSPDRMVEIACEGYSNNNFTQHETKMLVALCAVAADLVDQRYEDLMELCRAEQTKLEEMRLDPFYKLDRRSDWQDGRVSGILEAITLLFKESPNAAVPPSA